MAAEIGETDEAERCDRTAIMHAGKLAAIGTTSELKAVFAERPILEIRSPDPVAVMAHLDERSEVEKTSLFGTVVHAVLRSRATRADDIRAALDAASLPVSTIEAVVPSLEDVFLDVVDRAEGDQAA